MAGSALPVALLSDGTTTIELGAVDEAVDKITSGSRITSAGGQDKVQTAGYRIIISIKARVTPTVYNAIKVMETNGSLEYQYTPKQKDINPIYVGAEIPIIYTFQPIVKDFDNRSQTHINIDLRSTKLFRC